VKNVYYLLIKQLAFIIPIIIGGIISGMFLGLYGNVETRIGVSIVNLILFSLPSVLVSLMFAMVPYLLADPKFNQKKHNPLRVSMRIMKGKYMQLILVRLFFVPWLALNVSSIAVVLSSVFMKLFEYDLPTEQFLTSSLFIIPLMYLLFLPWYRMMHAELYASLRHKVKGYR
jgi:MFS family permease